MEQIGTTSVTCRFEVTAAASGEGRATARLTVAAVVKPTMTKRPIPDWLRTALERVRIPGGRQAL